MAESIDRFPLFLLGMVLLPGEAVPLHVFEERYKTMIGECIEAERPFGVLWRDDSEVREIGCVAEISEVLEQADDGRMNIVVTGTNVFRRRSEPTDAAYPIADIELLDDVDLPGGPDPDLAAACREGYADLVERVTDKRPEAEDLEGMSAYAMAATIAFEAERKQELLELRSEDDRLGRLTRMCAKALERYEFSTEVSERAQTNGKVQR